MSAVGGGGGPGAAAAAVGAAARHREAARREAAKRGGGGSAAKTAAADAADAAEQGAPAAAAGPSVGYDTLERRYGGFAERIVRLSVSALLSSTAGRVFVMAYMAAMHLLVFVSSYYIVHKQDCVATLAAAAAAATANRAAAAGAAQPDHLNQFGWDCLRRAQERAGRPADSPRGGPHRGGLWRPRVRVRWQCASGDTASVVSESPWFLVSYRARDVP